MLKHLSVTDMLDLSTPWVTLPASKAVFLSIPEIAPLHPKLAGLHAELTRIRPGIVPPPPALHKVLAELTALDATHDALARAVFSGLQSERAYALAASPPDLARAREAQDAATTLFPKGLLVVNASVLGETGHAILTRSRLDRSPKLRALLDSIPVHRHGTLLALTERWLAVGKQLGELDSRRHQLQATHARKRATKAEMNAARGRFIRLLSLVLGNLALSEAPKQAIETIRRPLLAASRRPAKRKPATPKPTDTTAPKPRRTTRRAR